MKKIKACVFNAYGTLLDTNLPFDQFKEPLGENAMNIFKLWRQKRLQYSSQLSLMNRHISYDKIRQYALEFACDVYKINDKSLKDEILNSHSNLEAFEDAADALNKLNEKKIVTAVLSNGTPRSLSNEMKSAKLDSLVGRIFSTEQVRAFKPAPVVYEFVEQQLGFPASKIAFVSSNSWDIVGAASYGFYSIWLNRHNRTSEKLPYEADVEIKSLDNLDSVLST